MLSTIKFLNRHFQKCNGDPVKHVFPGGVFHPRQSVLDTLVKENVPLPKRVTKKMKNEGVYVYPFRVTFDIETYFSDSNLPKSTQLTVFEKVLCVLSIGWKSNVPGHIKGKCKISDGDSDKLVGKFIKTLRKISTNAYKEMLKIFEKTVKHLENRVHVAATKYEADQSQSNKILLNNLSARGVLRTKM